MEGVAAMARAGVRAIVDDAFIGGAVSQQRWQQALAGLDVLWIAVRCDRETGSGGWRCHRRRWCTRVRGAGVRTDYRCPRRVTGRGLRRVL
jgi:Chloramphenicol phosphotransferase-like protein